MIRNKGGSLILLKFNSIEKELNPGQILDVRGFGVEADKDRAILEDRFIAKYPDSIERFVDVAQGGIKAPTDPAAKPAPKRGRKK